MNDFAGFLRTNISGQQGPGEPSGGGDDSDSKRLARIRENSRQAVMAEQQQTESLRLELATRRQIQTAYDQVRLVDARDYFAQEKALVEARRQEELALIAQESAENAMQTEAKRQQILNDTMLTETARTQLLDELNQQRLINLKTYEDARTEAERKAADDRKKIAEDEKKVKELTTKQGIQAGLDAISRYGPQLFGKNKKLAKASALVATYSSVQKSWDNAGGYPWGIVPAGLALAIGLKNVANIGKTNISGGGVSVGGGAASTPTPPALVQQLPQQSTVEIRGLERIADQIANMDPRQVIPVEYMQQFMGAMADHNRLSGEDNG